MSKKSTVTSSAQAHSIDRLLDYYDGPDAAAAFLGAKSCVHAFVLFLLGEHQGGESPLQYVAKLHGRTLKVC